MTPATFPEANRNLTKPEGMTDDQCGPLPTYCDGATCISLWRLTWRERLQVLLTGSVWLGVLSGHTQPPVWLAIRRPFVDRGVWQRIRERFRRKTVVTALALLSVFLALPAFADTGTPSTAAGCVGDDPNCADASMSLTFAGMATITGETPTEVKPTAFIEGEMPLPVSRGVDAEGNQKPPAYLGRAFVRLGISTSPGAATTSADVLASPANFQSVEGGAGLMRYLGQTRGGISKWAIIAEVGFKTRRGGDPLKPVQSSTTYWGAGFRFAHASGSTVTVLGGQDGELGDTGAAQVMVYGSLVMPGTAGIAAIVVDSSFSFFAPTSAALAPDGSIAPTPPPPGGALRSSIVRVGVAADLAQAFGVIKRATQASTTTSTTRPPEVSKQPADARFGPPAPERLVSGWAREGRAGVR